MKPHKAKTLRDLVHLFDDPNVGYDDLIVFQGETWKFSVDYQENMVYLRPESWNTPGIVWSRRLPLGPPPD